MTPRSIKTKVIEAKNLKLNDKVYDGSRFLTVKSIYRVGVEVMVTWKERSVGSGLTRGTKLTIKVRP